MSDNRAGAAGGGIGFTGALALVFITLKLLGAIKWSWLWVLSPLWIAAAIFLLGVVFLIVVALIVAE